MALTYGTNCGFVTTAPTADPGASSAQQIDDQIRAIKHTVPSNVNTVTEIGFFQDDATSEEANFEVGIYTHNAGDNNPEALVAGTSRTNAKGTATGWKVVTGLSIAVTADTVFWIAVQVDDTPTITLVASGTAAGKYDLKNAQTTLIDPFGASTSTIAEAIGIYALVENVSTSKSQVIIT